jgi:phosphohistidine phosphatase
MARWLNCQLPDSTRVLVSPALRARQTADALQRKYRIVMPLAPGGGTAELLQVARWPDGRAPVLIVGHQPTLGLAAAQLLAGAELAWSVRKGAIWWLRGRERDGRQEVVLLAALSPEQI